MTWNIPNDPINLDLPTLGGRYLWADIHLLAGWRIQKNILTGHFRLLDSSDKRRAWGRLENCLKKLDIFKQELGLKFSQSHIYLLLHGLGRSKNSMAKTEKFLTDHGHLAYCLNYPSNFKSLENHADHVEQLLENLDGVTSVSFIGHSLGGLVARHLLARPKWRRNITAKQLIMLGTPNNGARIADMMSGIKLFKLITGPSGQDVRSFKAQNLPHPDIPTLIIAGGRGRKAGFNPLLGEDNDGVVTISETKLEGVTEFKVVKGIHTTLMYHPEALQAILKFIH